MDDDVREAYEADLFTKLYEDWDPKRGLALQSVKTEPLSDEMKEALADLARTAGLSVTFPVEPKWGATGGEVQHFVRVVRMKNTPEP